MSLSASDKTKIKWLKVDIDNLLKKATICFIVAQCAAIISILLIIVFSAVGILDPNYSKGMYACFGILYGLIPIYSMHMSTRPTETGECTEEDKRIYYITYIVTACPIVRWILCPIFIGFSTNFIPGWYGFSLLAFVEITGRYFFTVSIPNIIGYFYMISAFKTTRQKWNIENAEAIQRKKEKENLEKENNAMNNLLSQVGNKFLVKYYFQLKEWSEPDILDIIEEDYGEETKRQRIRKAKEIFNKKLEISALKQISDASNVAVDTQTKEKAKQLLNQLQK